MELPQVTGGFGSFNQTFNDLKSQAAGFVLRRRGWVFGGGRGGRVSGLRFRGRWFLIEERGEVAMGHAFGWANGATYFGYFWCFVFG